MVEQDNKQNEADRSMALGHLRRWRALSVATEPQKVIQQFLKDGMDLGWWENPSGEKISISPDAPSHEAVTQYGSFVFNRDIRELVIPDGQKIKLMPTEAAIFDLLITHPGRLVPKSTLYPIFTIRGMNAEEANNNIRIYISYLRRKIKDTPISKKTGHGQIHWRYISTITRSGYTFNPDGIVV